MKKQIDVRMPYLVTSSGTSFVEYRCFYPATNKVERFRIYKGLSKLTGDKLLEQSATIIAHFSKKLKAGWRPWCDENYIYQDEIEYRNITTGFGNTRNDKNHLRRYLSEFLTFKKNDVSDKTYESYQSKTRLFCVWLEKNGHTDKLIAELDNTIMINFFIYLIQIRKLDKVTVKKYRQILHSMFEFFLSKKLIDSIPFENLPKASKTKDLAARPFFDAHIKSYLALVSKEDPQLFLASLFQFFLLCRPGKELRLLKIKDVDISRQRVYINDVSAKVRSRNITMPTALIEIAEAFKLQSFPGDFYVFGKNGKPGPEPRGKNYFNNHFRYYREKLGFPDTYKFYSFKHTGAGKFLESGATLAELMNQLGHTNFESTFHYVRRHFGERSEKIMNLRPSFLDGLI